MIAYDIPVSREPPRKQQIDKSGALCDLFYLPKGKVSNLQRNWHNLILLRSIKIAYN